MDLRSQGLLLHSFPYLESHRILKIFTPDQGLITLMARFAASKKSRLSALSTPFLLGEWVYTQDKREIHTLKDGTPLDDFAQLKDDYERLAAAGQIAQDLLKTQMPGKEAPLLFNLAVSYFRRFSQAPTPAMLAASFRLKLLVLEGLIHPAPSCAQCDEPATELFAGEGFCRPHAPPGSLSLTQQESRAFHTLAASRSFSDLMAVENSPSLAKKIGSLFTERTFAGF